MYKTAQDVQTKLDSMNQDMDIKKGDVKVSNTTVVSTDIQKKVLKRALEVVNNGDLWVIKSAIKV